MPSVIRGETLTLELVVEPTTPLGPVPTVTDVLVDIINPSAVQVVTNAAATEDPDPPEEDTSRWTYDFEAADDAPLGEWTIHWTATVNGEDLFQDETFEVAYVPFVIPADSSICNLWATVDDLPEECSGLDAAVAADMLLVASELLYEKSGRQFPGICEATVWPCSQRVSGCFPSRPSRCTWGRSYSIVTLGIQPIIAVSEVIIDGEILDPSLYRIDNYRELVRLDNADGTSDVWPRDDETFKVTFTYGQSPPRLGVLAAAALACQLGLRFTGSDDCKLPDNVQSISRQGVTMTLINEFNSVQQLGIAEVGLFLDTYNPRGLRRRATVWSPDMDRVRRVGT